MCRTPIQTFSEPAPKKRKLGLSQPSASQENKNGSFTEVLEKLKEEAKETGGANATPIIQTVSLMFLLQYNTEAEGGSDCWSRPPIRNFDPKKDPISRTIPSSQSMNARGLAVSEALLTS